MAPRPVSKATPVTEREKALLALLALTWLALPLIVMHAGLDTHAPPRAAHPSARRALVDPLPQSSPLIEEPSLVDTSTTSLYHFFSVPVLASVEPIPKEDLDEVTRIVLAKYESIKATITGPGLSTGHLEQV